MFLLILRFYWCCSLLGCPGLTETILLWCLCMVRSCVSDIVTIITTITDKQLGDVGVGLLCSVLVPDSKCVETVCCWLWRQFFFWRFWRKITSYRRKFCWFSGPLVFSAGFLVIRLKNSPVRVFKRWSR